MPVSSATWRSASRSWSGSAGGPSGPSACDPFIGQPYARLRRTASPERLASARMVARIRPGSAEDVGVTLGLFDEAVDWLAARGQTGQWGTEPFSSRGSARSRIPGWASAGGLWIAEAADGTAVGAVVVGARPPWVAAADEPERYIEALVTSRRHAGQDVGGELVRHAMQLARAAGVSLLR